MGMLEVLVMLLETEAAHHNNKDGRLRQSLMMESLNHCVSTPNAPQVHNPLSMRETPHQVISFATFLMLQ